MKSYDCHSSRDARGATRLRPSLAPASLVWALCAACGTDFFSADVAGYVKRAAAKTDTVPKRQLTGLNEVEVRIYLNEPSSPSAPGYVAHTITGPNRASVEPIDGFFSHGVAWDTSTSDFGADGDLRSIWLTTKHDDYEPVVVKVDGILTNSVNVVPDLLITGREHRAGSVAGRVLLDGEGRNGVRVVLDFEETDDVDHETRTMTVSEQTGVYRFDGVTWPQSDDSSKLAHVAVADPEYRSDGLVDIELEDGVDEDVQQPLEVHENALAIPSLSGVVLDAFGQGVAGVRVQITGEGVAGDRRWSTTTAADGTYEIQNLTYLPAESDDGLAMIWLQVVDPFYEQVTNSGEPIGAVAASDVSLTPPPILVARRPRTVFAAQVMGRCIGRPDVTGGAVQEQPLGGVVVKLALGDDESRTLINQSDQEGRYEFFVEWTDEEPTLDAPPGEDTLDATLEFEDLDRGEDRVMFEDINVTVRSWVDPNVLPDAVGRID